MPLLGLTLALLVLLPARGGAHPTRPECAGCVLATHNTRASASIHAAG
jgi:hypothetical protein